MLALVYGVFGLVVGSFLNVVIDRAPARESLLAPPSSCPFCGRRLVPQELIPVWSYLTLKGRCRTCGARIPIRVLLVEIVTGLLFAFLWHVIGPSLQLGLYTVHACILLVIMVIDLEHKLVLNVIVLPAILFALVAIPLQYLVRPTPISHYAMPYLLLGEPQTLSASQLSMIGHLAGGVSAFGVFLVIWLLAPAGMGAGDVKLAAYIGLILAIPNALVATFGSFVLGGVVAVGLIVSGLAKRKSLIPFAPFLVVASFVELIYGDQLLHWYFTH